MIFSSFIDGICIRFVGGYPSICDHRLSTKQVQLQGQGRGCSQTSDLWWDFANFSLRWQFSPEERICFWFLGDLLLFGFFSGNGFWWSLVFGCLVFFAEKKFVGRSPWLWKRLWIWDRMVIQKTIQSLFGGRIFSSWFTSVQTSQLHKLEVKAPWPLIYLKIALFLRGPCFAATYGV